MHRWQFRGLLGIVDHAGLLLVVDDFHVLGSAVLPAKPDPELAVDPDRMLSRAIVQEGLEVVARRNTQLIELSCGVDRLAPASRDLE